MVIADGVYKVGLSTQPVCDCQVSESLKFHILQVSILPYCSQTTNVHSMTILVSKVLKLSTYLIRIYVVKSCVPLIFSFWH